MKAASVLCAVALFAVGCSSEGERPVMDRIKTIESALDQYFNDHDEYPDGLNELLLRDEKTGKGPYLNDKKALVDPWGKRFDYELSLDPQGVERPRIKTKSPEGEVFSNF